jgi:hypothetical protein
MMVLDEERIWHFVSDTFSGKDDMGMKYGFKHSWWIGGTLSYEEVTEIDNQAIDAMNQTIQIWLELAENGEDANWKREKYGGKFLHGCPLCQYVAEGGYTTMMDCGLGCPMAGHWGRNLCDYDGATYNEWVHEDDPDQRKVKARAIVNEMIKVRAEMIANLEETKEETMENIVELNVEKKVTNKLSFKIDDDDGVRLIVVNEGGERMLGGTILHIKPNGTLQLASHVNKDFGLRLDGDGRIVIE